MTQEREMNIYIHIRTHERIHFSHINNKCEQKDVKKSLNWVMNFVDCVAKTWHDFFFGSRAYSWNRIHHTNLHTSKHRTNKFGVNGREGERNLSFVCGMKERIFYYAYGNPCECLRVFVYVHTVWAGEHTEYTKKCSASKINWQLYKGKKIVCEWELAACVARFIILFYSISHWYCQRHTQPPTISEMNDVTQIVLFS